MFRIDYIGTSPYINCRPSLYHHRLGPKDRFLILSSDGLYQYFTNEEAVSEVELFISWSPEGDPAQHLVEELLFRAAKKAGILFCFASNMKFCCYNYLICKVINGMNCCYVSLNFQVWIFMNCLKFLKEIDVATMMMFPLLSFLWKVGFGDHVYRISRTRYNNQYIYIQKPKKKESKEKEGESYPRSHFFDVLFSLFITHCYLYIYIYNNQVKL